MSAGIPRMYFENLAAITDLRRSRSGDAILRKIKAGMATAEAEADAAPPLAISQEVYARRFMRRRAPLRRMCFCVHELGKLHREETVSLLPSHRRFPGRPR